MITGISNKIQQEEPEPQISFQLFDKNSIHRDFVEEKFRAVLEPLYGDQTISFNKILEGKDRTTKLLMLDDDVIGLLIYKRELQNMDLQEWGIEGTLYDCLELKTLFLIDASKNSQKGFGSILMNHLCEVVAKEMNARLIAVTVSDKSSAMAFFNKKGFDVITEVDGKYVRNAKESLLVKALY